MPSYLLHPMVVHFPIAFLIGGFVLHVVRGLTHQSVEWMSQAETWLLWCGTAGLGVTLGLGFLAEAQAPHVPPAWRTLRDHKELALWATGAFVALSLWRWLQKDRWPRLFSMAWAGAVGLLVVVAHYGARLVFDFGVAVARP